MKLIFQTCDSVADLVGEALGDVVGDTVGLVVGDSVGDCVGEAVTTGTGHDVEGSNVTCSAELAVFLIVAEDPSPCIGGKNFDAEVDVPTSGGRTNFKQKDEQQQREKRKEHGDNVANGRVKARKSKESAEPDKTEEEV